MIPAPPPPLIKAPPPPPPIQRLRGARIPIGRFFSTVLPTIDFETKSEAGYIWSEAKGKWVPHKGATGKKKYGLSAVGGAVYAEHKTTDVVSCAYDLKDGKGLRWWFPGDPLPVDLIQYLLTYDPFDDSTNYDRDGLIEAHNSIFEVRICLHILAKKYNWPHLELEQFRCSMAKARAHALPGSLAILGDVLDIKNKKDPEGDRLIKKFSIPQQPTKKNGYKTWITVEDDPEDAQKFFTYNGRDVEAESEASEKIPDLPPQEVRYWLCDQRINSRGMECDRKAVKDCIVILEQVLRVYNSELKEITGGLVTAGSQVKKLREWLSNEYGIDTENLDEDTVEALLKKDYPPEVLRALTIRQLTGSASVKKVFAMARQTTRNGRLCDMAIYHGARTGRDNGDGVQPLNMPKAGPGLRWCTASGLPYSVNKKYCPHCGKLACKVFARKSGWEAEAVDFTLSLMASHSLEVVEYYFEDALLAISGCARGLFIAKEGHELIGVDYSSIEAVVAAVISGEEWRIQAFKEGRDIYLESASRITGHSYDWYMANGGKKHPDRQNIGKPAELGLGFGGWIPGWRQFDDTDNYTDDQVKDNILAWRDASPKIVEMWGGQTRGKPWKPSRRELFGLEGMAILAIQNPGQEYSYRGITYFTEMDRLYCRLPSGRHLTYHKPRLRTVERFEGVETLQISYMGWNTNPKKKGGQGWVRMDTHGAQLFENVVQAIARDIMANAVINLEANDFPVVLRVHDEIVTEVPIGSKVIQEQVLIMTDLPPWAANWPVRAAGWDTPKKRYQKD